MRVRQILAGKTCTDKGCMERAKARGMCAKHYGRARRRWEKQGNDWRVVTPISCSVPGCEREFRCTGFCEVHYARYRQHGDPLVNLRPYQEKHGLSKVQEHRIWRSVKARCLNPANKEYKNYGGRGIKVCERWANSFSAFYADMGPRPSATHSINRIDNDGNYEPSNCHWATSYEQAHNTRRNKRLRFKGQNLTVSQWTVKLGFTSTVITMRLKRGWSVRKTLTTPVKR